MNSSFMLIQRAIEKTFLSQVQKSKVLILLGARRVGKTAFLNQIRSQIKEPILFLNGDDYESHGLLNQQSTSNYLSMLGNSRFLIIDEAQEINNIGKKLKLIVDAIPDVKVIITGSSAFELNNQIGEPLVGRMKTFYLYPLAQIEFSKYEDSIQTQGNLEERLVFGSFPELIHMADRKDREAYLKELVHAYLLKDILAFEGIKKRDKIMSLLQKLAFRVGSEISVEGLGKELQISKNTVDKYLDLFSKVYVTYSVSGFSRNRDNEITKMKKWYFMDNGIRNALVQNFKLLSLREDTGILWENYLNSERIKKQHYQNETVSHFFWRTHTKQEIDRIEIQDQQIQAYEYKFNPRKIKIPTEFSAAYPNSTFEIITKENYLEYIL